MKLVSHDSDSMVIMRGQGITFWLLCPTLYIYFGWWSTPKANIQCQCGKWVFLLLSKVRGGVVYIKVMNSCVTHLTFMLEKEERKLIGFHSSFTEQIEVKLFLMPFLFSLNTGPMLKRKLQVSPSTFALKNPVRDKWAQQSHTAEDSSSCDGPTDAAHAPRTQPAACSKGFIVILVQSI